MTEQDDIASVQTWEEACANSYAWAINARKQAKLRRHRKRAVFAACICLVLAAIATGIVVTL